VRSKIPSKRVPGGYPQVAHPHDRAAYGRQISFVYGWCEEMLARLSGEDAIAARAAREALGSAFLGFTSVLLRLARAGEDKKVREWAGRLLASVHGSISKHDEKLLKVNKWYRLEQEKFGELRVDVLFPKGMQRVVQREFKKAERMRKRLLMIQKRCGEPWREVAERQRIPESYLPAMKLQEFCVKSEPVWWKFLRPLIKKKMEASGLLRRMRPLKVREYDRVRVSRRSRRRKRYLPEYVESEKKTRKRYFSDLQKGCRDHLRALARQRDAGLL
jgi:hypothetical protein